MLLFGETVQKSEEKKARSEPSLIIVIPEQTVESSKIRTV